MKNQSRTRRVRVATYNVHKCRGIDGRVRPDRIADVLRELDADIVALQEVVSREGRQRDRNQARYLAEELGYHAQMGETRRHRGGAYGNLLLSRFPIHDARHHDVSVPGRERRGCLRADVRIDEGLRLHLFNIHLGTAIFERRIQARELFRRRVFTDGDIDGPKIVLGDFNEWKRDLASHLFNSHFESVHERMRPARVTTFPGVLPMLPLDHIYFDSDLKLDGLAVHRSRMALVASDHLPLVADFSVPEGGDEGAEAPLPHEIPCGDSCEFGIQN